MTTLLLHGLGADRRQPLELLGPVLDPGERVVAPDVRAHGAAAELGTPPDYALDTLADDLLERTGPLDEPLTVVGISMGAALALRIALRGLLPIERAVFIRPAFSDVSLPPNLLPFPVIGGLLTAHGPDAGARAFRHTSAYHAALLASPAGGAALLGQFRAADAAERAIRLIEIPRNRAFGTDAELGALGGIDTLVVGAPRDPVHPLPLAERWAGALGAPLVTIPARDDGHARQVEALRALLARHLAR